MRQYFSINVLILRCKAGGNLTKINEKALAVIKQKFQDGQFIIITCTVEIQKLRLSASSDPNISISSSNPNQYVSAPAGNAKERTNILTLVRNNSEIIEKVRASIYNYILLIYNKL